MGGELTEKALGIPAESLSLLLGSEIWSPDLQRETEVEALLSAISQGNVGRLCFEGADNPGLRRTAL